MSSDPFFEQVVKGSIVELATIMILIGVLCISIYVASFQLTMAKVVSVFIDRDAPVDIDPFTPDPAYVNVSDLVIWSNLDTQIHTATAGELGAEDSGRVFDSGILSPKATFEHKFDQAGEFDYYCALHPQMTGKVIVRQILRSQPSLEEPPEPGPFVHYTDPQGFFSLQYPSNWKVEYKTPVTRFDSPTTRATPAGDIGFLEQEVKPSTVDFITFRDGVQNIPQEDYPGVKIEDYGFGVYSLGGYETFAILSDKPEANSKALYLHTYVNGWESILFYAVSVPYFEKSMPVVERVIDSIRIPAAVPGR